MKKTLRYIILTLVVILVALQLVPNELPPVAARPATDLLGNGKVPEVIGSMLKTSCYDCHSMETKYPWYSELAPVSWLVSNDIRVGREELNFSDWTTLAKRKKVKSLENLRDEVLEGHMPMPIYLVLHREARLTDEQRKQIADWADGYQDKIMNEPDQEDSAKAQD